MIAGHEFGTDKGAVFIIMRALYGLKLAGAAWRTFFAQALTRLEFKPMQGDRDVYIKPQAEPNGDRYYEMLLVYVDDILIISHDTKPIIDSIASHFCLKGSLPNSMDDFNQLYVLVDLRRLIPYNFFLFYISHHSYL